MSRERFDVVFYAPWASSLVGSAAAGSAGGSEHQLLMLATGMARRGLKVGMIMLGERSELPAVHAGVRIIPQRRRRGSSRLMSRASLAVDAFRAMAGLKTDVLVQRNSGPTTGVAAVAARLRGARFVYSSASEVDFEFDRWERSTLNVKLFEWGVRHASQVVVQHEGQARRCRARFGREPAVIKSIAEPSVPRAGEPEAFLWVGRPSPVKRPLAYIELAHALPEARFWMIAGAQAGDPPELVEAVEEGARELPQLELLAPRSRAAVGELIERAVAVVNTSEREGLSNVFLEGWARGVPALTLSFDPDGLVAGNGLGAFAEGDQERFEEHARRLWRERHDQRALAERCIGYVRAEHDSDSVVERWIEAIG